MSVSAWSPGRSYRCERSWSSTTARPCPWSSRQVLTTRSAGRALSLDDDETEFVVPVQWLAERPAGQAVKAPGLFASQVTVCRLKDDRTIEIVTREMGIS